MTTFHQAGSFSLRLSLERNEELPDGQGGNADRWQHVAHVWAMLEPVSAELAALAGGSEERITHRIHLRRRQDLSSDHRFSKGARHFRILTARDPDETGRYTVCECIETP